MPVDSSTRSPLLQMLFPILEEVFDIEAGILNVDSDHENVDGWDSLKMVYVAIALEEKFQISLSPDEVVEMISVRRIIEILQLRT